MAEKDLIINDAKSLTEVEFLNKYKSPFLVQYTELKITNPLTRTSFFIGGIKDEDIENVKNSNEIKDILIVEKSGRNSFPNKITVGRAPVQDIIIRDAKISKFHAYFDFKDGSIFVVDHGSTNGSYHNAIKIKDSEQKKVSDDDIISFGDFSYTFYSNTKAYQIFRNY